MNIRSRVIRTELVKWQELQYLQADDFKALLSAEKEKLRQSIIQSGFTQPFYVWLSPDGVLYSLDGFHRTSIMREMVLEGIDIPALLPGTFIECDNLQHAARLVLQYSSVYAKVTEGGMLDFLEAFNLNFDDVASTIDLPDFAMGTFISRTEQDFSGKNMELDLDTFTDGITMKLVYSKADYLEIKQRIGILMGQMGYNTPEQLIKALVHEV